MTQQQRDALTKKLIANNGFTLLEKKKLENYLIEVRNAQSKIARTTTRIDDMLSYANKRYTNNKAKEFNHNL